MVVEADGGSRGNPGPAGYGAVVKDAETGEVLAERRDGLGVATNNFAEYSGLLAGLAAAAELGASTVDIRMDSKLVVEQMSGRWKIKHPDLQPLAARARELSESFERVRYEWIPRASNSHADRLANEAMDTQAGKPPKTQDRVSPAKWSGAVGTPTKLLLLRHGQTEMSVERRYSGRGDVPLTEHGRRQADAAAKRLAGMDGLIVDGEPAPVIASPLLRTQQTAQAVADALGGRVETHQGLIETDFGSWEGLTFTEAAQRDPDLHSEWISDSSVPAPGGESFDAVHRRVRAARDDLVERFAGRTVVVVSHVTPIKSLLRLGLDAGPSLLYRLHLDLASLSIVEFYPDGNASVRLANDISHLT
ncbi:bifunctional RNase H/acid phosphatase [Amycolatopsis magusensis]|uniref:bifunctional RNase H/acid phosphatase n=1 Tax=Amycolatopsis magusensis TaxID=882444 RepID=UPI0037AFB76B